MGAVDSGELRWMGWRSRLFRNIARPPGERLIQTGSQAINIDSGQSWIETLRGLGENPTLVARRQASEAILCHDQVVFHLLLGGRKIRAPGQPTAAERLDQARKERLRGSLCLADIAKDARCQFQE